MKRMAIFLMIGAMISGAAQAEQAIAYHGKLIVMSSEEFNRNVPVQMEFRLYRNIEPGETTALWGRRISIRLAGDGTFYTELKDSAGTDLPRTSYKSIADAVASAKGAPVFISLTPVGYTELLPRKALSGVHRSEYAAVASAAKRLETPELKADEASVGTLKVGGKLNVKSFVSAGGRIVDTIDGNDKTATLGMEGGKVVFSDKFDCWNNMTSLNRDSTHVCADALFCWRYSAEYGAFVLPHPIDSNVHSFLNLVATQQFLLGFYSATWK